MKNSFIITLIALTVAAIFIHFRRPPVHQFGVTFFDIGQGDAALIQFRNGEQMLVDCGADKKILPKLGQAIPFYDRTIEYLIITHPDLDHYGGCADVLKRYAVKKIITNGHGKAGDPYWEATQDYMAQEHAVLNSITAAQTWTIASSTLEFLSPDPALKLLVKNDDSNNYSITFRLVDAPTKQSILFTADMEEPLEQALLAKYCQNSAPCPGLHSHILKVGHHGSDSSSGAEFLAAVAPQTGVISVGKNNRYGHPSRRVLKRLERAGMRILRTDEMGDMQIKQ